MLLLLWKQIPDDQPFTKETIAKHGPNASKEVVESLLNIVEKPPNIAVSVVWKLAMFWLIFLNTQYVFV